MSRTFIESGMTFGPFEDDAVFAIEASAMRSRLGEGIKAPEFVWLAPRSPAALWLVEAKSSSPQPGNTGDLHVFLRDVSEKFVHGLTILVAACLGRHTDDGGEVPAQIRATQLGTAKIRLILVVNGHKTEWLPPLQDALRKELSVHRRVWGIDADAIVVLNDAMAVTRGLVARQ